MPAIDGLLALLELQPSAGLVLEPGRPPALVLDGGTRPLTMPPLDAGVIRVILAEVLGPDKMTALEGGQVVETTYASPRLGAVSLRASRSGGGLSLTVTRTSRSTAPAKERPAPSPSSEEPRPPQPSVAPRRADDPGDSPVWEVLRHALRRGASDILISTAAAPALRIAGEVGELGCASPTEEELLSFFGRRLTDEHRRTLEATGSVDLAFEAAAASLGQGVSRRFRVNVFRHLDGLTAAMRPLWASLPTLEALHLPSRLTRIVAPQSGMVLLAGLAGSGKSTTLAVLVEHLNQTRARHIVTLEDPIEYVFQRRRSVIHQREVGTHIDSFASGLRAALRESPDVILVGEMRDRETISLALTAAETGHLVLSTIHSSNAATGIDRIVDVFPETQQAQARAQLGNVMRSLVTQRLLPGREPGTRVPVVEVLNVNHAVASHIREGKTHMIPNQMQVGGDEAMLPYDRNLVDLVRRGLVASGTAVDAARDREYVLGALGAPR